MADKKKLSVAEILAAARKQSSSAPPEEAAAPAESPADPPPAAEPVAAAAPGEEAAAEPVAAAPKPALKPGERPNVKDILAMARAKPGAAAPAAAAKPAAAKAAPAKEAPAKPAGDKPAAKPAAAKAATPASAAPRDTASILAAAGRPQKSGPLSKAEAAARGIAPPTKEPKIAPPMPEKPAYALPKPAAKVVDQGRRAGLMAMAASVVVGSYLALGFSSLAATFGLWSLGLARFMFPNVLREPPSKFKVGFPGDFAAGAVETKFIPQFGVWVVNWEYNGRREIYALKSVCTHLGCTPNWLEAEQKFKCPCHGSGFYKDGINFEGPAPRPLERYAIELADDGQLQVDKSRTFQEEMGQWDDPASFVALT